MELGKKINFVKNFKTMDYTLPSDPFMLMSFINMKLRDQYASLDDLCDDMDIDKDWLLEKLRMAGFDYSAKENKFW